MAMLGEENYGVQYIWAQFLSLPRWEIGNRGGGKCRKVAKIGGEVKMSKLSKRVVNDD